MRIISGQVAMTIVVAQIIPGMKGCSTQRLPAIIPSRAISPRTVRVISVGARDMPIGVPDANSLGAASRSGCTAPVSTTGASGERAAVRGAFGSGMAQRCRRRGVVTVPHIPQVPARPGRWPVTTGR